VQSVEKAEDEYPGMDKGEVKSEVRRNLVHRFHRELRLPKDFDPNQPCIVFCALGNNTTFLRDLTRVGCGTVAVVEGRNHASPNYKELRAEVSRHPEARIFCTQKDFLKIETALVGNMSIFPVQQRISLDLKTVDLVEAYRVGFTRGNLVHYNK
jgi:tetraacyldisaccharide-1-P 4'-kinase